MAMEAYEQMKKLIAECDEDVKKAVGGNKAAVRQDVLNMRDASEGGEKA